MHSSAHLNTHLIEIMYQASIKVDEIVLRSTMRAGEYVSHMDDDFALTMRQMTSNA